jgi:hypothetical protein
MADSELSDRSIRYVLLADVCADLFQFEFPTVNIANPPAQKCSPEKFRSLALKRAIATALFPFKNPITDATGWLRRNRDTHVHMVRHQMALDDRALLLPSQRVEDRTQLPTRLAEDGFPPSLGHEHNMAYQFQLLTPKDLLDCCRKSQPQSRQYVPFLRNEPG